MKTSQRFAIALGVPAALAVAGGAAILLTPGADDESDGPDKPPPARSSEPPEPTLDSADREAVLETFASLRTAVSDHPDDCAAVGEAWHEAIEEGRGAFQRLSGRRQARAAFARNGKAITRTKVAVAKAMSSCSEDESFKAALKDLTEIGM